MTPPQMHSMMFGGSQPSGLWGSSVAGGVAVGGIGGGERRRGGAAGEAEGATRARSLVEQMPEEKQGALSALAAAAVDLVVPLVGGEAPAPPAPPIEWLEVRPGAGAATHACWSMAASLPQ